MSYKIKSSCLKFSTITVFMLFFQMGFTQKAKVPREVGINRFEDLDVLVQQNQKLLGGNVVAMVWTDTLVYKRELGDFDSKTAAPIASASKWLTAALVLMFVDEGKISLDDKVSKYIPDFELYGKNYVTIRHCLSHYTGVKVETGLKAMFARKKYSSLKKEAESYAKSEIQANAGTEFRYSNVGLNTAAAILEIVSKKKFDMLIKQKLLNPLNMRKTSFSTLDGSLPNPSGGAVSTADDYLHCLQMLLNNGKYNGVQILSEAAVKEMRKMQTLPEQIKYAPKAGEGFGYALGSWVLEEGKDNEAKVLSSPGLFGTWPMVDWCRGYAAIFFVKTLLSGEQKKDVYLQMKDAIDEKIPPKCKE
ncbi:MAG TPA: serine hydrolase [Flavisolibacter sp.]|nr:serine hydrolase [Flavisolibacter sp.]